MESGEGKDPGFIKPESEKDEFGPLVRELIKEGGRVTQVDGNVPTENQKREEQRIIEEAALEMKNPGVLQ